MCWLWSYQKLSMLTSQNTTAIMFIKRTTGLQKSSFFLFDASSLKNWNKNCLSLVWFDSLDDDFSNDPSTSCVGCLSGVSVHDVIEGHLDVVGWGLGFLGSNVVHVVAVRHSAHVAVGGVWKEGKQTLRILWGTFWIITPYLRLNNKIPTNGLKINLMLSWTSQMLLSTSNCQAHILVALLVAQL